MLILLAIICIVFLAYATSFDNICDALPMSIRDTVANACRNRTDK
jgi:hypothetical protein